MSENDEITENQNLSLQQELQTQIEQVNQEVQEAKKLVNEISEYHKRFVDIRTKLDDGDDGLEVNLEWSQTKKSEIDAIKASCDENLNSITSTLATVQAQIAEMKTAHADFTAVQSQINDAESGLAAVLSKAQAVKTQIDEVNQNAASNLEQIKGYVTSVEEKVEELSVAHSDFTEIKAKIDDEENGLAAILAKSGETQKEISAVKEQADGLFIDIKKFRDEAKDYTTEISGYRDQSEENLDLIKGYEEQSQDFKGKIAQIYKMATDSSLGHSFAERKGELKREETKWYLTMFISFLLLGAAALYIYRSSLGVDGTVEVSTAFWYKITFTSPLIFLVGLATERYAHERNMLERYAFKAATAFALENYTTLLKNTFAKDVHEVRILNFVLNSMTVIYKEPFEQKTQSRWSFGLNSKVGEVKTEVAKTAEEIIATPITDAVVDAGKNMVASEVKKVTEQTVTTETKPIVEEAV